MISTAIVNGMSKTTTLLSVLRKVFSIPYQDRGHINIMLVSQSCTDSQQVMAASTKETLPTSFGGAYQVGSLKVEVDLDMQEEEEEVNVKPGNGVCSEEVECMDVKDEEAKYSEAEEEEDIDAKEDKDVDIKEEVSLGINCNIS